MRRAPLTTLLALAAAAFVATPSSRADDGCRESRREAPSRLVYECPGGLILEAEAAAALRIRSAPGAVPAAVEIERRGILVRSPAPGRPLQILTPHAVASVRGTLFVVDVEPGTTAVFAAEGAVAVRRPDGSEEVLLSAGDGVDVAPGDPIVVQRWSDERVAGLLARFGR